MIVLRHIITGITLIIFGISTIRFMYKNPDLFQTLSGNKIGIYGLGIVLIYIGIMELFGQISWN